MDLTWFIFWAYTLRAPSFVLIPVRDNRSAVSVDRWPRHSDQRDHRFKLFELTVFVFNSTFPLCKSNADAVEPERQSSSDRKDTLISGPLSSALATWRISGAVKRRDNSKSFKSQEFECQVIWKLWKFGKCNWSHTRGRLFTTKMMR